MSYQDILVYQRAHKFGVACHHLSMKMPKFELYETGSQLRRAAKSVSANIVEGYGRREYAAEYHRFLVIALASNDETREWLTYMMECHPHLSDPVSALIAENEEIGRMLNRFIQSLAN